MGGVPHADEQLLELAAVGNLDGLHRAVLGAGPGALNLLHHVETLDNLAKHHVAPVPAAQEWQRDHAER